MPTITVQIGNSDDKLTQEEWAHFIDSVGTVIRELGWNIHFSGGSLCTAPWQNYCWVCEADSGNNYRIVLSELAKEYRQNSIAVTVGETSFLGSG